MGQQTAITEYTVIIPEEVTVSRFTPGRGMVEISGIDYQGRSVKMLIYSRQVQPLINRLIEVEKWEVTY